MLILEWSGHARLGKKTKELVKELRPREIAVIDHEDLDAMGATGLVDAQVTAVINAANSISGRYPNLGPRILLEHNIPLIDNVGSGIFDLMENGNLVKIIDGRIYCNEKYIGYGRVLSLEDVGKLMDKAKMNIDQEIAKFVDNTLEYVQKEKSWFLSELNLPDLNINLAGRHVVVVVRGIGYRDDLQAISAYIDEMNPVLIGVDGGADALLEFGHKPDLIVGDMDSVSDVALLCGAEILVHAYPDGRCPGRQRIEEIGVPYTPFPAPGTSEDIALLLAYEKKAELIVAVGTHSNLIDFLEKGRPGMASTFLVRMKVGSILVDAKGVSKLYQSKYSVSSLPVVIAALVPIMVMIALASPWRQLFRLLWLQLRVLIGGI